MKLFLAYVKQHRKAIVAALLFCVVFGISFALYHLPLAAVAYPVLLCALFALCFVIVDLSRVKRRHRQLEELGQRTAAMLSHLPEAESIVETDYQAIVENIRAELAALVTETDAKYRDMVEYYTVWVHQIKTPITSMRLTLQNEDTSQCRRLSADLFQIEQYVEMVLAFLRLDSESGDYVFAEHGIDAIVRQAVSKFSMEFIERKIRFVYTPIEETVVTDDKWLSFVVEQVLSNALKYTKTGSIKMYLEPQKILCIEDTGIGIAPEDLPRIFEKGYTGYNGRRDKTASGIGLYLCRRICENLGARIDVTSAPGKGTTVRIHLAQYALQGE